MLPYCQVPHRSHGRCAVPHVWIGERVYSTGETNMLLACLYQHPLLLALNCGSQTISLTCRILTGTGKNDAMVCHFDLSTLSIFFTIYCFFTHNSILVTDRTTKRSTLKCQHAYWFHAGDSSIVVLVAGSPPASLLRIEMPIVVKEWAVQCLINCRHISDYDYRVGGSSDWLSVLFIWVLLSVFISSSI